MNLGEVGLQFECAAVAGGRFVQLALVAGALPRLLCAKVKSGFNSRARPKQAAASGVLPRA